MREPAEDPNLDELAAWIGSSGKDSNHSPNSLMRPPWRLTWHQACRALEALEARGDLERIEGRLSWRPRKEQPAESGRQAQAEHLKDRLRRDLKHLFSREQPSQPPQEQPAGSVTLTLTPVEARALRRFLGFGPLRPPAVATREDAETLRAILDRLQAQLDKPPAEDLLQYLHRVTGGRFLAEDAPPEAHEAIPDPYNPDDPGSVT